MKQPTQSFRLKYQMFRQAATHGNYTLFHTDLAVFQFGLFQTKGHIQALRLQMEHEQYSEDPEVVRSPEIKKFGSFLIASKIVSKQHFDTVLACHRENGLAWMLDVFDSRLASIIRMVESLKIAQKSVAAWRILSEGDKLQEDVLQICTEWAEFMRLLICSNLVLDEIINMSTGIVATGSHEA